MLYVTFDENGTTYVPAIGNSTFDDEVGANGNGGLLVLRVSLTYHRWEKNVPNIVHDEHGGDFEFFLRPPRKKPHKYAYCGPPMQGHVKADWIKPWLVYHNYLWNGDALFFFYNVGGLSDEERHHLKEFEDAGLLIITELTGTQIQSLYPSWYFHQRLLATSAVRPPLTINGLLLTHIALPWLTFGSIPADFVHCTAPAPHTQHYPIERMLWHDPRPECSLHDQDPWLCVAHHGRRKWVANTKHNSLGGVHRAALPAEGGQHVDASVARVIHFHGVLKTHSNLCGFREDESSLGYMERDEGIKREIAKAKRFPVKRKQRMECSSRFGATMVNFVKLALFQ